MKLKKIILIILSFLILAPVCFAVDSMENAPIPAANGQEQAETVENNTVEGPDIADEESIKTTPMTGAIDAKGVKSPYENNFQEQAPQQNEFTKTVFMFLKVMMAVAICSVIIFVVLLGIKKFYGTTVGQTSQVDNKIKDNLKPTNNENEALKIFLNRTKNQ